MQLAVTNRVDESFQPVPKPRLSDWLRNHKETGQTMKSFEKRVHKAVPHATYVFIHSSFLPLNDIFYLTGIKPSTFNQWEVSIIRGRYV